VNPSLSRTVNAELQTRCRNKGLNLEEPSEAELFPKPLAAAIWTSCKTIQQVNIVDSDDVFPTSFLAVLKSYTYITAISMA